MNQLINKAIEILNRGWCVNAQARDNNGEAICATDHDAVQWCLVGAIYRAERELNYPYNDQKRAALASMLKAKTDDNIGLYNDTHTKEEVIQLLQKVMQ